MKTDLRVFITLQVLGFAVAVLSFTFLESRQVAGAIAGTCFVLSQGWMLLKTVRWANKFKYPTFYLVRINLWIFSLPMVIARARNWNVEFAQLNIWGIPGPEFHRLSELCAILLILATAVDYLRVAKQMRNPITPS